MGVDNAKPVPCSQCGRMMGVWEPQNLGLKGPEHEQCSPTMLPSTTNKPMLYHQSDQVIRGNYPPDPDWPDIIE